MEQNDSKSEKLDTKFDAHSVESILDSIQRRYPDEFSRSSTRPQVPLTTHPFSRVERENVLQIFFEELSSRFSQMTCKNIWERPNLRDMNLPIATLSGPGGGKSFVVDEIAKFTPEEVLKYLPLGNNHFTN